MPTAAQKIGAYARLLRLSNGPTAVADVWMGYAVTLGGVVGDWPIVLATLASLFAYHGGMALNDAVDSERDKAHGRGRPIELGLVTPKTAYAIAWGLIASSFAVCLLLYRVTDSPRVAGVGLMLVALVVAYNSRLKSTWLGPTAMGACRLLNVLLGVFSVAPIRLANITKYEPGTAFAVAIGIYIVGVTWFARDEAGQPSRHRLAFGLAISLLAIAGLGGLRASESAWPLAWAIVALVATRGMAAAILQPTPQKIGRGVGVAIQGLVVIDAVLAAFYAGPVAGLAILALLPVTMILAQWIPQT